jgi:TFIIF-interacting CTD phosphatase-like protein
MIRKVVSGIGFGFFDPSNSLLNFNFSLDPNVKNLRQLFPADDSMVVIVDDREDVWMQPNGQIQQNLLRIQPCMHLATHSQYC